ncbi:hypothetical protein THAOC_14554 [Thalassiosira oceanica]|uniref:Uncharacterized protein n=1 Tax=Thalassiosira oceanica TaxID=159749 RepID=K0T2T6_THAOC|nr:hypothetical protein THAOC_14554 [Thalassiosira oceanica]|eukprot:EJK64687.1 hypothetical protein THAOC_14554 [Thalassiosira oceanica]
MGGRSTGPAQNFRTSTRQISTDESALLGKELELDLILKFYRHVGNICSSPVQKPVENRPLESSAVQPRGSMAVRLRSTNSSRSGKDEDKRAPRLDSAHRTTPETMSFGLLRIDLPKLVRSSDTAYRRSSLWLISLHRITRPPILTADCVY